MISPLFHPLILICTYFKLRGYVYVRVCVACMNIEEKEDEC